MKSSNRFASTWRKLVKFRYSQLCVKMCKIMFAFNYFWHFRRFRWPTIIRNSFTGHVEEFRSERPKLGWAQLRSSWMAQLAHRLHNDCCRHSSSFFDQKSLRNGQQKNDLDWISQVLQQSLQFVLRDGRRQIVIDKWDENVSESEPKMRLVEKIISFPSVMKLKTKENDDK